MIQRYRNINIPPNITKNAYFGHFGRARIRKSSNYTSVDPKYELGGLNGEITTATKRQKSTGNQSYSQPEQRQPVIQAPRALFRKTGSNS